jgi:hypothetical protein
MKFEGADEDTIGCDALDSSEEGTEERKKEAPIGEGVVSVAVSTSVSRRYISKGRQPTLLGIRPE